MRKTAIAAMLLAMALLLPAANAAWSNAATTVDVNGYKEDQTTTAVGTTENGVLCVPDDGNFTVTIENFGVATGGTGVGFTFNGGAAVIGWVDGNGQMDADNNAHVNVNGYGSFTVAAPTTEGYKYLCVHDTNAWDTNKDCEWVTVQPDSTYAEFTINSSDGNGFCKQTNYSSVSYPIFYDRVGKIEMQDTVDMSADTDYDASIDFTNDKLVVSLAALNNKTAKVTLNNAGVRAGQFEIYRGGVKCGRICSDIHVGKNGAAVFTTTNFSTYEVKKAAGGGILPSGGPAAPAESVLGIPTAVPVGETNVNTGLLMMFIGGTGFAVVLIVVAVKSKK